MIAWKNVKKKLPEKYDLKNIFRPILIKINYKNKTFYDCAEFFYKNKEFATFLQTYYKGNNYVKGDYKLTHWAYINKPKEDK